MTDASLDLIREIRDQNKLIIEQNGYIIGSIHRMATNAERITTATDAILADIKAIKDDTTATATALGTVVKLVTDLQQQVADLKANGNVTADAALLAVADKLDLLRAAADDAKASADATAASASALSVPPDDASATATPITTAP